MTLKVVVIAALSRNGVIGKNNGIPWKIGGDMKRFKALTMGYACIMGRRTFESLPENAKPLPGRENVVLTSNRDYTSGNTKVLHSFREAIAYVRCQNMPKAYIAGGASLYQAGLSIADILELTIIEEDFEGDVYFPKIDWKHWDLVHREDRRELERNSNRSVSYSFRSYRRK